ncbi:methyl-viologen-reducing hydrogenase delta subunit [Desulfurobacterium thermolithotrophum DSM 11699]|uniref:Methyl-viologen-reducing hydrogenase delta subunit n=1 Tax=Desulfurobacterium thermolithotrophum (strain DSM 11699 / BSA) TaxID=868864 RepID=F0S2G0_DESTD|nr:hydrogenase iron-sulfur subunit [Desulfurobacterium thermolithotrophum]ADY73032.1 methyl-viologen-reducing hydrogenase delta subunit [Desulfurobacterium thermolithotrophum DSM 11699]
MKKVGVVFCSCGEQINQKINFKELKELALKLPGVEEVIITKDLCKSPEKQLESLRGKVSSLIFGGCSERSSLQFNEDRIQKLLKFLQIDPAMFETLNLREQCVMIHDNIEGINAKAKDMLLMAYEKLKTNVGALKEKLKKRVLIVGGGVAGQSCAQALADIGVESVIVEEKPYLGGLTASIPALWQSESYPSVCTSQCVLPVVGRETMLRDRIKVLTNSEIEDIEKDSGTFKVKIRRKSIKINPDKCIACGECEKVCPVEVPNEFNLGKTKRKAIYKPFPLAIPDVYHIDEAACIFCGECEKVCPTQAINLQAESETIEEEVGAIVIATGLKGGDVSQYRELGYEFPEVITLTEYQRYSANNFFGNKPKEIAFILCKKDEEGYCSRLCCLETAKIAALLAKQMPDIKVRIFYRSLRTTGRAFEEFRKRAEAGGVEFIQTVVEKVEREGKGKLRIKTEKGEFTANLAVLAEPLVPAQARITQMLNMYTDIYGFPLEFQPRVINPLESFVERVYVIGTAKGFKDVQESIESALGVAPKIYKDLKGREKKYYAQIDQDKCSRCETCLMCCPHGAISVKKGKTPEDNWIEIDPNLCRGCGLCYAACPSKAINFSNLEDEQILKMVEVAFKHLPKDKPRILAFLCYWCAYGAADLMGVNGEKLPENFRSIRVRCSASLSLEVINEILSRNLADGIIVAGCPEHNCHHVWGNYMQERRIEMLNESLRLLGVNNKLVKWEYIGVPNWKKLANSIRKMNEVLTKLKEDNYVKA